MLTEQNKRWLGDRYPELAVEGNKISGKIEFAATYNSQAHRFLQLDKDTIDGVGGISLSGQFKIEIEERSDTKTSRLPALSVEDVEHIPDRHFNQTDQSACVCNPLEEDEFLQPELDFERYFEQLVIPFLYGQLYFTQYGAWPWPEYAHGGVGIIEAFSRNMTQEKAIECLGIVSQERVLWHKVKIILSQKGDIGGHAPCPCPDSDHLRRCHPEVLKGLRELRSMVKAGSITLP